LEGQYLTAWTPTNGKRKPGPQWGDKVFVQLRNGMEPPDPWPVNATRWINDREHPFDVVAIKMV